MKVLFIGGTGVISSACAELALARGIELYLLNRGESARPAPAGARILHADIRDRAQTRAALAGLTFDAVVDWVAFTPEHVAADIELFRGGTARACSSTRPRSTESRRAACRSPSRHPGATPFGRTPRTRLPVKNGWSRRTAPSSSPVTIVRPSHTYDRTKLPTLGYYTTIARLHAGKPAVVHGDGTSLWVLTHHRDFAVGFVGLLGNTTCGRRGVPYHLR